MATHAAANVRSCAEAPARAHSRGDFTPRTAMRAFLALSLLLGFVAGCTPYIPVKPGFGTSAAVPLGDIPPEFAEFNNFDPAVNTLLATQICATPYQLYNENSLGAVPGGMVQTYGRCRNHVPLFGP
jgi:hypothetical protein